MQMSYAYIRNLGTFDLSHPAIQQLQRGIHPQQHSLIWPLSSSHRLGVSEIDKFHQTRRTRLGILFVFVFRILFIVFFPSRLILFKESNPLFRALDITLVDDQKATANHSNLEFRKHVPDCGDAFSDRLDDWQQQFSG